MYITLGCDRRVYVTPGRAVVMYISLWGEAGLDISKVLYGSTLPCLMYDRDVWTRHHPGEDTGT
jgi:hypothetical protein